VDSKISNPDEIGRRDFLKKGLVLAAGIAGAAAALSPLRKLGSTLDLEEYFRKHYKMLSPQEMEKVLQQVAKSVEDRYGVRPDVKDPKPLDGVEFGYALNLSKCIGCRKCVHACVAENNSSRSPEIQYIRVLRFPKGKRDLEEAETQYAPETVPEEGYYYMPVQCHQCRNPPCVRACPVQATWQEPDGITVVDYNWCIGCRFCMAACPYHARRFNFSDPSIPKERLNPDMGYLSNRPRSRGVVEKCQFCLHRTRVGKLPACAEVCPTGARKFGNLLDPESAVSYILKNKNVFVFKEEMGTVPRFYYYFDT